MFRRSSFYLPLLGAMLLTLALVVRSGMLMWKNPGQPINAAMRAALAQTRPEYSTADDLLINRLYPTFAQTKSGLRFVVTAHGAGDAKPQIGDEVTVRYVGHFLGGAQFARDDHLTFRLGVDDKLKGWDEALLDMKAGEERTVVVPWWLGYGAEGSEPTIPPRATLVFDLKLLRFR